MSGRTVLHALLLFAVTFAMQASVASADDFVPPPWGRAEPFAITAEWEFLTDDNPIAPDGPLTNVGLKGSGSAPSGTFASLSGLALSHTVHDGDGAWIASSPIAIHIEMDNVIDSEPVKHLWLQLTHGTDNLVGVDILATLNGTETGSTPDMPIVTPIDATHTLVTWNLLPNPSWETFDISIDSGAPSFSVPLVDQIVLDTISVPEPSTLIFAALAIAALIAWAAPIRGTRNPYSPSIDFRRNR